MAKQSMEELQEQIAALQAELTASNAKRSAAEQLAHAMTEASQFVGNSFDEQPTGNTIFVEVCTNPTERNVKKQVFKEIEYPTYFYNIQLPAGAGLCLSTNGVDYYHGQTYEFDSITLAEMKSRVARCWDHEKMVHGDNENAYRRPTNQHLMTKAAQARSGR